MTANIYKVPGAHFLQIDCAYWQPFPFFLPFPLPNAGGSAGYSLVCDAPMALAEGSLLDTSVCVDCSGHLFPVLQSREQASMTPMT